MSVVELLSFGVSKLGSQKKLENEIAKIKKESGLSEIDWNAYREQAWKYPREVQTEIEAKNDEQAEIFEKDVEDIEAIASETKSYLNEVAPELNFGGITFFDDKTISLSTCHPVYSADANGKSGYDMSVLNNKLAQAYPYLYGAVSDTDIHEEAQITFNQFEDLYDESNKNMRIIKKGLIGEENVSRALQRSNGHFTYLENIVIPAYGESGKTSETDVYIISSKGIFVCEVKNYGKSGETLHIYDEGQWPVTNEMGVTLSRKENAFRQNQRHCNATRSFIREYVGVDVPIIPVLIIGNDYVDLDVHSNNIVIRPNGIDSMVSGFNDVVDTETQKKIINAFNEHQLDKNDFPAKVNVDRARYISSLFKEYIPYMKVNAQIAEKYSELHKNTNRIVYPIIAILILLTTIPLVKLNIVFGIVAGLFIWTFALGIPGKLSGVLGIGSAVFLALWVITMTHPFAIVAILCLFGEYKLSERV